jgi:hypothetical protein
VNGVFSGRPDSILQINNAGLAYWNEVQEYIYYQVEKRDKIRIVYADWLHFNTTKWD